MTTVTVKTEELDGAALDWAVAQCIDDESIVYHKGKPSHEQEFDPCNWANYEDLKRFVTGRYFRPSINWDQGGPLIREKNVSVVFDGQYNSKFKPENWQAYVGLFTYYEDWKYEGSADGPTPLIAAMRAIVASDLGDIVEIPEELL